MIKVMKRDGEISKFMLEKIDNAITKAFLATENKYTEDIIHLLSLRVTSDFQKKLVTR